MRFALFLFCVFVAICGGATAQTVTEGSFKYDAAAPGIVVLAGPVTENSIRDFRRALRAQQADTVILNSPGGRVQTALELSAILRDRGMSTLIPPGGSCASACAFLFVAGSERRAYGRLGVHQFTSNGRVAGSQAEQSTQQVMAQIIDYLKEYKVPPQFLVRMLETPPDGMYWFPKAELRAHGIETLSTFPEALALYDAVPALSVPIAAPEPVAPPLRQPAAVAPAIVAAPTPTPVPVPARIAPSFDCKKAGTPTEFAICASPEIAQLDATMAARYHARRAAMSASARQALTDSQRDWLARRNQCGSDQTCLRIVYASRLQTLTP